MDRQITSGVSPIKPLRAKVGTILTALLALSVPAFALGAVTTGGQELFSGPAIAAADDQVANGLRIVEQPQTSAADANSQRTASGESADELALQDWRYTGKPNPSPGH
jgi:hypothetical protein